MEEEKKDLSVVVVRRMHPLSAWRIWQFLLGELTRRNILKPRD